MFYTEKKLEDNQICLRREIIKMLLAALPFLALCVAGFAARNQTICTIGLVLACAAVIFVGDLFVAPVVRYGKFLRSIQRVDAEDGGRAGARRRRRYLRKRRDFS